MALIWLHTKVMYLFLCNQQFNIVYVIAMFYVYVLFPCLQPGASWESAQAAAAAAFTASAAAAQLPAPTIGQTPSTSAVAAAEDAAAANQPPQLTLQLVSWTGGPRPMPLQQQQHLLQHNMRFKTLRVLASGIRSRSNSHRGQLLGSVLYSDTFLDVSVLAAAANQCCCCCHRRFCLVHHVHSAL
jgi:hypothetical protein